MTEATAPTYAPFTARFADMTTGTTVKTFASFVGNQATLANYTPTSSPVNTGMLSDIGRATIYGPDLFTDNFYSRFVKTPLPRGDSAMTAVFSEVTSNAYSPKEQNDDAKLFNANNPTMISNVAKKNLSRQVAVEINDYILKQMAQTPEMIGDVASAIMGVSNACYLDDMWVASKAYFSGSTATTSSANSDQLVTMLTEPGDDGFADEMVETIWKYAQNKFRYKSALYNESDRPTLSHNVHIALKKDYEFPAFKKLYAETFNPSFIDVSQSIDYVEDFATPAGAPEGAGALVGMIVDDRKFSITPMPDTLTTEAFRNPARKSTAYFTTYEYAFQKDPMFNCVYIFAPAEEVSGGGADAGAGGS